MAYYINSVSCSDTLQRDVKELIPAPEMRRRMSRVLKMAVSTAMDALGGLPDGERVSAVITATGLGCLADSEKFLRNVVENGETLLNPTPFIQSTFNTVGAQVALLTGNHGYNMTYVHGGRSFESALLDAMIQIDDAGAEHVLVGAFDEVTPTQHRIMERMGAWRKAPAGEGAYFFVVSARPLAGCVAEICALDFADGTIDEKAVVARYGGEDARLIWNDCAGGVFHTASARALWRGCEMVRDGGRVVVCNDGLGDGPTVMVVECMRR